MATMIHEGNRAALFQAMTRRRYTVGLDLGQSVDPSAICVLERVDIPKLEIGQVVSFDNVAYTTLRQVRYLERLPLQAPYPDQVEHVARMMATAPLSRGAALAIDMTGVGRPIFDLFKRAGLKPIGITITGGDDWSSEDGRTFRVSKLLLVSRLLQTFHEGSLKIAKSLPEAVVLARELQDFRVRYSEIGQARFGAREGKHDDLVLALAIAVWWDHHQTSQNLKVKEFPL